MAAEEFHRLLLIGNNQVLSSTHTGTRVEKTTLTKGLFGDGDTDPTITICKEKLLVNKYFMGI